MPSQLSSANTETRLSDPPPKSFTLSAKPYTDIYAAPAHGYVWSAPIIYKALKTKEFKRARLSITLKWTTTYDQGGLIVAFPAPSNPIPNRSNATSLSTHPRWVKAGIEVNDNQAWISVVARDGWADWSLASPPSGSVSNGGKTVKATLQFEKHDNALMIFVLNGERKLMVREVQWVFLDEQLETECWIGVYVARPDAKGETSGPLEVQFEGFDIEV